MSKTYRWDDKHDPRKDTQKPSKIRKCKAGTLSNFGVMYQHKIRNDMKAYIYEVEATNTGFICIAEVVESDCEKQIDDYYQTNYDSDHYGYQFNINGLTVTKQTTHKTLRNNISCQNISF